MTISLTMKKANAVVTCYRLTRHADESPCLVNSLSIHVRGYDGRHGCEGMEGGAVDLVNYEALAHIQLLERLLKRV